MVIVVKCESCKTDFRLNEALLKGAKGASIRCPKCRERFIVENPQAPPVAPPITHRVPPPTAPPIPHPGPLPAAPPIGDMVPPPIAPPVPPRIAPLVASMTSPPIVPPTAPPTAVETGIPTIRVAVPRGMTSPVPPDRLAEGADLSGRIRSEPVAGVSDGNVVSPAPDAGSGPPYIPWKNAMRVEELFIPLSEAEKDRNRTRGEDGPMTIRPPGPGWSPPPRRPLYRRPLFLAVAIPVLLLAGVTFYSVDGNSIRKSSDSVISARARNIPENSVLDVGNLKGSHNRKPSGESFYVVKGTVTNIGKTLSSGIRIEATLMGKDNQAIVKNGTFAGNVIDESLIPHMSRVRIEGFLGMRHGEGDVNRDIPAGKTLPFMVVFFEPPEGVESFRVKAIDADEVVRKKSPDGEKPGTGASIPK